MFCLWQVKRGGGIGSVSVCSASGQRFFGICRTSGQIFSARLTRALAWLQKDYALVVKVGGSQMLESAIIAGVGMAIYVDGLRWAAEGWN